MQMFLYRWSTCIAWTLWDRFTDILFQSALWLQYVDRIGRDIHTPGSFELSGDFSKHTRHIRWEEKRCFTQSNAWYLKDTHKDQQRQYKNPRFKKKCQILITFKKIQEEWSVNVKLLTSDSWFSIIWSDTRTSLRAWRRDVRTSLRVFAVEPRNLKFIQD